MSAEIVGDKQFGAMCKMWGVDRALEALAAMDMEASYEQIETERKKENEVLARWNRIFAPKEG